MYPFGCFNESDTHDDNDNDEMMYKSPQFVAHAKAVFGTVDAAVGLVAAGQVATLAQVLVDLGVRHHRYGVVHDHFAVVGAALLHTLQTALGAEHYTHDVKEGWTQVYGMVSSGMEEGCYYAMIAEAEKQQEKENEKREKQGEEEKETTTLEEHQQQDDEQQDEYEDARRLQREEEALCELFGDAALLYMKQQQPQSPTKVSTGTTSSKNLSGLVVAELSIRQ